MDSLETMTTDRTGTCRLAAKTFARLNAVLANASPLPTYRLGACLHSFHARLNNGYPVHLRVVNDVPCPHIQLTLCDEFGDAIANATLHERLQEVVFDVATEETGTPLKFVLQFASID